MDLKLRVFTPIGIALETPVTQVDFEAIDGFYTLLPKHADMVSALKTGVLSYMASGEKTYIACNQGVLVKKGDTVSVSTKMAVLGTNLKELEEKIAVDFKRVEQERKEMNASMAKLEVGLTKGIISLKQGGVGNGTL